MRRILSKLQQQRGQVIIMFVAIFTIITIVGVVVVDFGLWFSERRGAQTDADLPALAGARECMLQLATGDFGSHDPYPAIVQWFNDNNGGNAELVADKTSTNCFDPTTGGACGPGSPFCCVDVGVKHNSKTLFSSFFSPIFDGVAGGIGAHARACAGAAQISEDILPANPSASKCFNNGQPDFNNLCWIAGGAHDNDCDLPGNRCWLNLVPAGDACSPGDGHKTVADLFSDPSLGANCIIDSHPPTCDSVPGGGWSDCVELVKGNSVHIEGPAYDRIHSAPCDKNGNGIDDLSEVLDPNTGDATICSPDAPEGQKTSPRLISVPVIDRPGEKTCANGEPCPIIAFGAFYIAGCVDDGDVSSINTCFEQHHDVATCMTAAQRACTVKIPGGHEALLGQWVKLFVAGSGITPADKTTTQFSIALCDWETPFDQGGCGSPATPTPGPTSAPTSTPGGPTATPRPPTSTPVPPPCPTVCNGGGKQCHPYCGTNTPVPTNTPRPPTPTRTPVPTSTPRPPTPTRTPVPTSTPRPPTATPRPPTSTPVPPTPCPTVCNNGGHNCHPSCP